ncbi:WD40 repeat-like protein [Nadsonia fulvescens var. elongata DSM 6958]|uniref:WD40 repeat-like protein n=1 Tax=Nadsonia fulvescens var. elongata DSM 6958 TaxID=857566 RepID=A0A1E3PNA6_9ASCO|nr:WD40 repeat-like protein [Nadsonia fulvescens var. elongata DSM 6958]
MEKAGRKRTVSNSMTFGNTLSVRVDEDVSAMSISPSGRDVVLASKQGLFVVDLDDPFSLPRWLYHKTSWEVADVQWSPHASRPYWVVSTSNQKAMVWNLSLPSANAVEHVLHGHFRAITDINFHPQHPDVLATCSVDTYVLNWDLRDPSKPSQLFSDWISGASQVKWNRINPNILASSHDRRVHLWDIRKGSVPFCTINAHSRKINGINFSFLEETQLVTCSSDGTVKFWDYGKEIPQEPNFTINTEFPVWRARYTPFGNGCVIMPLRGGNNSVFLVDRGDKRGISKLNPVYEFNAHTEPVHEFLWRSRGGYNEIDDREFQLITWSKDHDLRLWPVSEDILQSVHFDRSKCSNPISSRYGAPYISYWSEPLHGFSMSPQYKSFLNNTNRYMSVPSALVNRQRKLNLQERQLRWLQGVRMGNRAGIGGLDMFGYYDSEICFNLGEELGALANKFPKVRFEKINVSAGICIMSMIGPWGENGDGVFIRLNISFPPMYPQGGTLPEFNIEESLSISEEEQLKIKKELIKIAEKFISVERGCLEACIRFLLDQVTSDEYNFESVEQDNLNEENIELFNDSKYLENSISDNGDEPLSISSDEEYIIPEFEDDENNGRTRVDGVAQNDFSLSSPIARTVLDSTPFGLGCGARWGPDGDLVCFFEKKERKEETYNDIGIHKRNDRFRLRVSRPIHLGTNTSNHGEGSSSSDSESGSDYGDDASKWILTERFKDHMGFKQRTISENHKSVNESSINGGGGGTEIQSDTSYVGNVVTFKDYRHLIPSRRELALEYKIMGDTTENLAKHNAKIAAKYGYFDVADCWRLLSMIDSPFLNSDGHYFWGSHPFGRQWMVSTMFNYFEKQHNVQMLANMSCLLSDWLRRKVGEAEKGCQLTPGIRLLTPFPKAIITSQTREIYEKGDGLNSYRPSVKSHDGRVTQPSSIVYSDSIVENHNVNLNHTTSNSNLIHANYNYRAPPRLKVEFLNEDLFETQQKQNYLPLLDPSKENKYQAYRSQYAQVLFTWGLNMESLEVMKYNYSPLDHELGPSVFSEHYSAAIGLRPVPSRLFERKNYILLRQCNFCGLSVKGRFTTCTKCEHIYHVGCAEEWCTEGVDECSSGCGCHCLLDSVTAS